MLHDVSYGAPDAKVEPDRKVASVAVIHEGKLLMGIRRDTGLLTFPGGGMNPGETPEEAAKRELWEETGLTATGRLEFLGAEVARGFHDDKILLIHVFRVFMAGTPTSRNDPDDEVKQWLWLPFEPEGLAPEFMANLYVPRNIVLKALGLMDFPALEIDAHVRKAASFFQVTLKKSEPESARSKTPSGAPPLPRERRPALASLLRREDHYRRLGLPTGLETHPRQVAYLKKLAHVREIEFDRKAPLADKLHHLRGVADGFYDLAEITGLAPHLLSYHGKLGVRLRSRGTGWTAATYMPETRTLELTQWGEQGSFAHEWSKSFDHALRLGLFGDDHVVGGLSRLVLTGDGGRAALRVRSRRAFERREPVRQAMQALMGYLMSLTGRRIVQDDRWQDARAAGLLPEVAGWWLAPEELFARAVERYVSDRLAGQGAENHYLLGTRFDYRWPQADEAEGARPLLARLFEAVRDSDVLRKAEVID